MMKATATISARYATAINTNRQNGPRHQDGSLGGIWFIADVVCGALQHFHQTNDGFEQACWASTSPALIASSSRNRMSSIRVINSTTASSHVRPMSISQKRRGRGIRSPRPSREVIWTRASAPACLQPECRQQSSPSPASTRFSNRFCVRAARLPGEWSAADRAEDDRMFGMRLRFNPRTHTATPETGRHLRRTPDTHGGWPPSGGK